MTDRELLELAALAAGYRPVRLTDDGAALLLEGVEQPWNPLIDDGDALRLAVDLNMDILQDPASSSSNGVEVLLNLEGIEVQPWAHEHRAPDPRAATRRAVVRAAAELGRQLSAHKDTK